MALLGKVETQVKINSSADKFFHLFRSRAHSLPDYTPQFVSTVSLVTGDWVTPGSEIQWTYNLGHGHLSINTTMERVDDESRSFAFHVVDGDVLKNYKTFSNTYHVSDDGGDGASVKVAYEYEKLNEAVPDPTNYLNFAAEMVKDIDSRLALDKSPIQ